MSFCGRSLVPLPRRRERSTPPELPLPCSRRPSHRILSCCTNRCRGPGGNPPRMDLRRTEATKRRENNDDARVLRNCDCRSRDSSCGRTHTPIEQEPTTDRAWRGQETASLGVGAKGRDGELRLNDRYRSGCFLIVLIPRVWTMPRNDRAPERLPNPARPWRQE